MRPFDYVAPATLDEAVALLHDGGARPYAGGTDLLTLMKGDVFTPERLVNIKQFDELDGISEADGGIRIGSLTRLSHIELSPLLRERLPALTEAASLAATPQLRNMATLGGNLLQRPRCWYYRSAHVDCWLKGGDTCPMHDGENRFAAVFEQSDCWAVHPSDLVTVLVALDASAEVRGGQGSYALPVEELLQPPRDDRRTESVLLPEDLITAVTVPNPAAGTRMTYLKAMDRKVWAFALVGVAVALRLEGGRIVEPSVVLGGVGNVPVRAHEAEAMLNGAAPTLEQATAAADSAFAGATPLHQNSYKVTLGKTLLRRAILQLTETGD